MANARIDRMIRELHTEPSLQFFQGLFSLDRPVQPQKPSEPSIPAFLLKAAAAN